MSGTPAEQAQQEYENALWQETRKKHAGFMAFARQHGARLGLMVETPDGITVPVRGQEKPLYLTVGEHPEGGAVLRCSFGEHCIDRDVEKAIEELNLDAECEVSECGEYAEMDLFYRPNTLERLNAMAEKFAKIIRAARGNKAARREKATGRPVADAAPGL